MRCGKLIDGGPSPADPPKAAPIPRSKDLMAKPIYVLNGPNLNMLGLREPAIYGSDSLDDVRKKAEARAKSLGLTIDFRPLPLATTRRRQ